MTILAFNLTVAQAAKSAGRMKRANVEPARKVQTSVLSPKTASEDSIALSKALGGPMPKDALTQSETSRSPTRKDLRDQIIRDLQELRINNIQIPNGRTALTSVATILKDAIRYRKLSESEKALVELKKAATFKVTKNAPLTDMDTILKVNKLDKSNFALSPFEKTKIEILQKWQANGASTNGMIRYDAEMIMIMTRDPRIAEQTRYGKYLGKVIQDGAINNPDKQLKLLKLLSSDAFKRIGLSVVMTPAEFKWPE